MLKKFEDQAKNGEEQRRQRVFVVHGRNEELRKSMFEFLRSIGLKPIEWSQAIQMTGETAPFIGDILDAAFKQAQAVVVLLNGDDEARLRPEYHSEKMPDYEKNLTPQARPNVIFEAGLALGRFPKRTIIVEVGDLRPFSDVAGRHTIRMNNSTEVRQDLAQRLSLAGCDIDLSGTDWHQSGSFEVTVRPDDVPREGELSEAKKNTQSLHSNQIDIMMCLVNNDTIPNIAQIANITHLREQRVLYFIDIMLDQGLVKQTHKGQSSRGYDEYRLTNDGFSILISNGLI